MRDGRIEQIGTPLELYDQPDNLFVAGFIGSPAMNFLRGTICADGRAEFEGHAGVRLPLPTMQQAPTPRPAVYGIRPEHLRLADDGAEAEVRVIEPTGSELQVVVNLGGEEIVAVFRERHEFKPGDIIRLKPEARLAHLFDQRQQRTAEGHETGKRALGEDRRARKRRNKGQGHDAQSCGRRPRDLH